MSTLPRLLLTIAVLLMFSGIQAEPLTQDQETQTQTQTQTRLGYLGMGVDKVPKSVRAHLPDDITKTQGVLVTRFSDESPAADNGIKLYDVLITYDGQAIKGPEEFIQKIRKDKPGRVATFSLVRQGVVLSVSITVGAQEFVPDAPTQQVLPQRNNSTFAPRPRVGPSPPSPRYQPSNINRRYPAYPFARSYPLYPRPPHQITNSTPNFAPYNVPQVQPAAPVPTLNIAGEPAYPMRKKIIKEKHAWGDKRNIWSDFYTDFTGDMWDSMINAPFDMGRMPGGWRAPSLSTPDPVTIGDAVTNQIPPFVEEMGNMTDFSD